MVQTQSIIVLVNRMNHVFLVPDFSSLVDSAHPTLPAGYSPPMPMPTCNAIRLVGKHEVGPTYKEAPGGQDVEHAHRVTVVVRTGG
jgi:hypothetical protein